MNVNLEHLPDGVAVLHGVHSPEALRHLSRSMQDGAVFEGYRGIVVDLGDAAPDASLLAALDRAVDACLRRQQVVAFAEDEARTHQGTDVVRRTLRLLDRDRALQTAVDVARVQAEMFAAAAGVVSRTFQKFWGIG